MFVVLLKHCWVCSSLTVASESSSLASGATGSVALAWYCVSVSNSWQQVGDYNHGCTTNNTNCLVYRFPHRQWTISAKGERKHCDSNAISTDFTVFVLTGANPVRRIWSTLGERWEIGVRKQKSSGREKKRQESQGENDFLCSALSISECHLPIVIK